MCMAHTIGMATNHHTMQGINMKITKSQLKQIIMEELSDYLSNIYKWCPEGSKCPPEKKKTKWWKGR